MLSSSFDTCETSNPSTTAVLFWGGFFFARLAIVMVQLSDVSVPRSERTIMDGFAFVSFDDVIIAEGPPPVDIDSALAVEPKGKITTTWAGIKAK